jgi:hypothetical protein
MLSGHFLSIGGDFSFQMGVQYANFLGSCFHLIGGDLIRTPFKILFHNTEILSDFSSKR